VTYQEPDSTVTEDTGYVFRYAGDHYQYNLSTKSLSTGTYALWVTVNGTVMHKSWISLR
jgi:hypothetical protein